MTSSTQRRKPGTLNETIEEVVNELKKEEDALLTIKERVLKEMRILKAEEISLQRLIDAHLQPSIPSTIESSRPNILSTPENVELGTTSLPSINLLIRRGNQGSGEESEEEEEEEEEEMED